MLKKLAALAAASAFSLGVANAATVIIDFEGFSNGEQVLAADLAGVAALAVDNTGRGPDALIAFDSNGDGDPDAPVEQDDPDLIQPIANAAVVGSPALGGADAASFSFDATASFANAGNIGIISENAASGGTGIAGNPLHLPADDSVAGMITFLFDNPVTFQSISFVDINSATIELLTGASLGTLTTIATFTVSDFDTNGPTNLGARVLSTFTGVFNAVKVTFNGSGALESLVVNEVPVPGAGILLLTGIVGFGFASRGKKRA